jgi:hypothetical protein
MRTPMLVRFVLVKLKIPSGVKRKDFKGPKPSGKKDGGRINFRGGGICKKGMNKKILRA